ncbi:hypothetical protein [Nocardioides sp. P5_E3]
MGDTSYVLGSRWVAGVNEPFLQSSEDRKTWTPVELPTEIVERGIALSLVAGEPTSGPFVAGVDAEDQPVVVMLDQGDPVTLPTPDYGRVTSISGAAASKKTLVVLINVEREEGGGQVIPLTSNDAGATWDPQAPLASTEPTLNGVVAIPGGGFLATGYSLRGTNYLAAAWFSPDGADWRVETSLPSVPGHQSGWSSWVSSPTVSGKTVYASISDERLLPGTAVRRTPDGRWTTLGALPPWRTPGASTYVVADGAAIIAMRSWNGLLQTGTLTAKGRWKTTAETGAVPNVGWWEAVEQVGDDTLVVGAHTEVTTTKDEGWSRSSELTPLALTDGRLESTEWAPTELGEVSGLAAVTDDSGNAFVAAQRPTAGDPSGTNDAYDVVGWFKAADSSTWEPAQGLDGPRTEFVSNAANHDGEWVVVGDDRASFNASDHSIGALWTSKDGTSWKRAKGPFDASPSANSWLSATCALPSGDLIAVGGVEDSTTGSRPLAFRRTQGTWKTLNVKGIGANATNLDSCANSGNVTLIQGTAGGRDAVWSTTDGKKFASVEVGEPEDTIGTIKTIDGGFIATGAIYAGLQQRAVVWLSSNAKTWHPVDLPADRVLTATDVVATPSGVVVALTGLNGPAMSILENADNLLKSQ